MERGAKQTQDPLAALPGPASSEPSSLFPPPTNTRNPLDREFLLGTETGALLAARLDARAAPKKDAPPAALHAFADRRRAVCAAALEALPCGARVALVATPGALFVASGRGPGLASMFDKRAAGEGPAAAWEPLLEVGVPSLRSCLWLGPRGGGGLPARFAWLVGGCICHGHLLLEVGRVGFVCLVGSSGSRGVCLVGWLEWVAWGVVGWLA